MRLPDSIFQLEEFVMFLKKSLLFSMALALLMFAGQASAQVTLTHVTDGTAGTVAGNGTSFTVRISPGDLATNPAVAAALASVTAVAAIEIQLEYASSLSLSVALPYRLDSTNTKVTLIGGPALTGVPLAVPAMIDLTFTTTADVTDVEFSISITGATVSVGSGADSMFPVPITAMITFNEGGTGTPGDGDGNGGDNGDTGMPMPGYDNLSVSLTRVGEGPVNAGDDVVVNVGVDGLEGATVGAVITIESDVATIKEDGVMAAGFRVLESDDTSATLFGLPTMLTDGSYGTLTLALSADYDGSMASISASVTVLTPGGMKVSAAAGDPVTVNAFSPSLEADATAVEVPFGETATATVTAIDTEGEAVEFTVDPADAGTVSDDGNSVTVSATGNATVTVSATAGGVATNSVTVVFTKAPPVLMTESTDVVFDDFGAMASVSVTAAGFDEGAEINFSYEATADFQAMEDGSSLMITTGAPGTVTVTATDGTASASVTITFSNPPPYLTASETDVIIPEGGDYSVTVSATGLEGVITYAISRTSGTATVAADTDGGMVTLTASGEGSAMVSVTASAGGMTTEAVSILFRAMPSVGSDATDVVAVPQATVPSAMAMVVATGFPEGAEITFNVDPDPSDHPYLTASQDDNVLTLTSTGTITVSVTASGAGVTTSAV